MMLDGAMFVGSSLKKDGGAIGGDEGEKQGGWNTEVELFPPL